MKVHNRSVIKGNVNPVIVEEVNEDRGSYDGEGEATGVLSEDVLGAGRTESLEPSDEGGTCDEADVRQG